jgi:DNA-binding NarL/FixJ family response regulator
VDDSRTRVVLADDDILLREGLTSLLDRSGLEVVGQAGDAAELIDVIRQQRPELAVVDIRMPPKHATEGLDAARVIQREFPETAVVVLSAHVEVEHAMDLLATGHRTGYLLKSRVTDVAEFIETLRRVVRGGSAVDPALVQELVAARRTDDPLDVLTAREREVLALMAEGRSNAGIGQALWVTEGTVEKHVRSIMMKLNLAETAKVHRRVLAVLGAMVVASTNEPPPPGMEERLTGFTELVAAAIANAQARVELRGYAEEQAALRRVATLVARGAPPEEVFAAVTEEVGGVMDADLVVHGPLRSRRNGHRPGRPPGHSRHRVEHRRAERVHAAVRDGSAGADRRLRRGFWPGRGSHPGVGDPLGGGRADHG